MRVSPQTIAALLLNGASAAALAVLPPPACTPDPERANRFTIDGLAYHTGEPVPRIHLKNGDWAYLSGDKALNTVRGLTLFSVALTAFTTRSTVRIECVNGNDIRSLWIEDF